MRLIRLQTVVSDNRTLLGESFDMLCLAGEKTFWDEQGEVCILHTRLLEHCIQLCLHLLPNGITIRFDDHTAADITLFSEVGLHDQFIVPLRVILASFCQIFKFFCHILCLFILIWAQS